MWKANLNIPLAGPNPIPCEVNRAISITPPIGTIYYDSVSVFTESCLSSTPLFPLFETTTEPISLSSPVFIYFMISSP